MKHPEKEMILEDEKDKYDDVIYEEWVHCAGDKWSIRERSELWKYYNHSGITRNDTCN